MRRRLGLVALLFTTSGCGSCFAPKPPPPEEITQGLEDTGSGWMPKAYASLGIPATPGRGEQWAKDPARHATYTSGKDCQKHEFGICNMYKYEYSAKSDGGENVYVMWPGAMSQFFRAEVTTRTEQRIFGFVHVPQLGSVIVEVARAPLLPDGGVTEFMRVPIGKLYDPYPAYKKELEKLFQTDKAVDKARALVSSYTSAFGPEDIRLAFDAYAHPRFADHELRRHLALWICGDVTEKKAVARNGTLFAKNDAVGYQRAYEKLFANETAASPLGTILTTCFAGPVLKLDSAKAIAKKLVAMNCAATDDTTYRATEGVRETYRKHRDGSPQDRELATFIEAEAKACAESPWKARMLKEMAGAPSNDEDAGRDE